MASSPLRVAILDDDQSVRTAITRLLNSYGMDADSYASSMELLKHLGRNMPDCLILDLQMSGMSGLDLMHYISKTGLTLPIIVVTAHDEIGSPEICLNAGAFAYLRKPLDAAELVRTIGRAMKYFRALH